MGWLGLIGDVIDFLKAAGADRDEAGNYLVAGEPIISGLDAKEVIIPDSTVYFVNGKPKNLADALASSSSGVKVTVIG